MSSRKVCSRITCVFDEIKMNSPNSVENAVNGSVPFVLIDTNVNDLNLTKYVPILFFPLILSLALSLHYNNAKVIMYS